MVACSAIVWTAVVMLFGHLTSAAAAQSSSCEKEEKRILITGISGMIGTHVAKAFLKKNDPCTVVYGLIRPRTDLSSLAGFVDKIEFVLGDITDSFRMIDIVKEVKPHYIYHFAAQAINGISFNMAQLSFDSNIGGTLNLLEALRINNMTSTRFLLAGSSTEYGNTANTYHGAIPEDVILDPVSPYGISKTGCEKLANQYFVSHKIPVVTARLFIHVGVGGTDSLAINQFCKQIALAEIGKGSTDIRHGNLKTLRDITNARDSAPILIRLAEEGNSGEAYNVGSGNTISIQSLLDTAIGMSKVIVKGVEDRSRLRSFDEKKLVANIDKIKKLTGWVPATDMTETVQEILNFWRKKVRNLYCPEPGDCPNAK
jgi:nucleoside-diphosphate-sugar epimerase